VGDNEASCGSKLPGTTVIVATHEKSIVDAMKKRVIALDKGVIVRDQEKGQYEDEVKNTKYIIKEGFVNTYRNVLMSLASMGVVSASLIILGFFLVMTANIEHNTRFLKEQPEMQVFCNPNLDDYQVGMLQWTISRDERIESYQMVDKAAAFEKAKEMLGEDKEILEGLDESIMPVSFIIKLKNSKDYEEVVERYKNYPVWTVCSIRKKL